LDPSLYEGQTGSRAPNSGLPRFADAQFDASYPLGQVRLADPNVPVGVRVEAFNPLVPGDVAVSSLPVAVLRFVLTNPGTQAVRASVLASIQNFIGRDGLAGEHGPKQNVNEFRASPEQSIRGLFLRSEGVDRGAEQWGTVALVTTAPGDVTRRTGWIPTTWRNEGLADLWRDFAQDGRLDASRGGGPADAPMGALCVETEVPAGGEAAVTFLLAWHFPNRRRWVWPTEPAGTVPEIVGNYYTTLHRDAWHVAEDVASRLPVLESRTVEFVRAFVESDLPAVVKEAALFNLAHLRTQTCFRTADGRFFGWEGGHNERVVWNCLGTPPHVWSYEQTTAFLFADLARSMRETNLLHMIDGDGAIRARVYLPIHRAAEHELVPADAQGACVVMLYREWRLSGDDAWLARLWPAAKRAVEFCWRPGSWDADRDGVMEGCQHNTLDTEYYGPNPVMAGWYLAALRAAERMARHLGDSEFADACRGLADRGRTWVDAHLFNGEFYEHHVRRDLKPADIDPRVQGDKKIDLANPPYQLGGGCLVDQLVGVLVGRVAGIDGLLDPAHVRRTLASIWQRNFRRSLRDHVNHLHTFAHGDEAAAIMCTYDDDHKRPDLPLPYYTTVMGGFEFAAAIHMLYEGMEQEGLEMIAAVRDRYDGRRRSPFNQAEWGNHYSRTMIAWAAVLALSGFDYDAREQAMRFAATCGPSRFFWSTGSAYGTVAQRPAGGEIAIELEVLHGVLRLTRVAVGDAELRWPQPVAVERGRPVAARVPKATVAAPLH
ncbi:MAG TPA: GH116 family glycosyl-hydrolase, partial [Tepidisphaeraceae bacterium]|nr:GH116 family glycosyl-hydrolase [Tepidisphaeraceae bacterium]